MFIKDKLSIATDRTYTDEGFLIVPSKIARTGIQEYLALEFGLKDKDPMDVIRVWRPEEEVFSDESLSSFTNKPVTDNHPPELVTAANSKQYTVGHSGPTVSRDGMFATTILHITDAEAIKKIESGKVELSNGYTSDIEWKSGITPDGENYDAIQRNIKGNHIAIVDRGRCGSSCRVSDHLTNQNQEEKPVMAKLTIDGVDYEASEQVVQAFGKVQARLTDAEEKAQESEEELKKKEDEMEEAEKKAKATEDSLKARIDDAMTKVPNAAMLDALVDNRIKVRDAALLLNPEYKWENKDCETVRRDIVADKCPDLDIKTVSADYIKARFDALVDTYSNGTNMLDGAFKTTVKPNTQDKRTADVIARDNMMERSRNAWKTKGDK